MRPRSYKSRPPDCNEPGSSFETLEAGPVASPLPGGYGGDAEVEPRSRRRGHLSSFRLADLAAKRQGLGVLGVGLEDLVEGGAGVVATAEAEQGPRQADLQVVGLLGLELERGPIFVDRAVEHL